MDKTPDKEIEQARELTRQIAWVAWKGAANSFRLYPDNNHTFTDYWTGAESQFDEFKNSIAKGLERERELEEINKNMKQYIEYVERIIKRKEVPMSYEAYK